MQLFSGDLEISCTEYSYTNLSSRRPCFRIRVPRGDQRETQEPGEQRDGLLYSSPARVLTSCWVTNVEESAGTTCHDSRVLVDRDPSDSRRGIHISLRESRYAHVAYRMHGILFPGWRLASLVVCRTPGPDHAPAPFDLSLSIGARGGFYRRAIGCR